MKYYLKPFQQASHSPPKYFKEVFHGISKINFTWPSKSQNCFGVMPFALNHKAI
jgi:hypothetical protein